MPDDSASDRGLLIGHHKAYAALNQRNCASLSASRWPSPRVLYDREIHISKLLLLITINLLIRLKSLSLLNPSILRRQRLLTFSNLNLNGGSIQSWPASTRLCLATTCCACNHYQDLIPVDWEKNKVIDTNKNCQARTQTLR